MRRWTACLVAALVLTACDAGHPNPGSDNAWPGPELDIQVPGPRTTVKIAWPAPVMQEVDGETTEVSQQRPRPQIFFRLRPLGEHGQVFVRYAIDDGKFRTLPDATKAARIEDELDPGTHLVGAYLVKEDGTPRFGARASSVSTFILEVFDEGSGQTLGKDASNPGTSQFGYTDDERLWQPFDPKMPCLVVDESHGTLHIIAHRCALDGEHFRARASVNGTETVIEGVDAASGRFGATLEIGRSAKVSVVLEEKIGDAWQQVAGSRSAWSNASE